MSTAHADREDPELVAIGNPAVVEAIETAKRDRGQGRPRPRRGQSAPA